MEVKNDHAVREARKIANAGTGIMLLKNGKVLLGKRHDDPEKADSALSGEGTWTFPGGKLDYGLTPEENVCKELEEETGLKAKPSDCKLFSVTNDIGPKAHFITLGFLCRKWKGEVKVMEPDEITKWDWFPISKLPKPLFPPCAKMLKNYKAGKVYRY